MRTKSRRTGLDNAGGRMRWIKRKKRVEIVECYEEE